jgi:hypothetical protein
MTKNVPVAVDEVKEVGPTGISIPVGTSTCEPWLRLDHRSPPPVIAVSLDKVQRESKKIARRREGSIAWSKRWLANLHAATAPSSHARSADDTLHRICGSPAPTAEVEAAQTSAATPRPRKRIRLATNLCA